MPVQLSPADSHPWQSWMDPGKSSPAAFSEEWNRLDGDNGRFGVSELHLINN